MFVPAETASVGFNSLKPTLADGTTWSRSCLSAFLGDVDAEADLDFDAEADLDFDADADLDLDTDVSAGADVSGFDALQAWLPFSSEGFGFSSPPSLVSPARCSAFL